MESNQVTDHKDKFLHIFTVKDPPDTCCCGISLSSGVRIITLFYILLVVMSLTDLKINSWESLISIGFLSCLLVLVGSILILLSTFKICHKLTFKGIVMLEIWLVIQLLNITYTATLVAMYYPIKGLIVFITVMAINLLVNIYFLWIIFCFYINLKYKQSTIALNP